MITLTDAIQAFLAEHRHSIDRQLYLAHQDELNRFERWVSREIGALRPLCEIDGDVIGRYMEERYMPFEKTTAKSNYARHIRVFLEHCRRRGWTVAASAPWCDGFECGEIGKVYTLHLHGYAHQVLVCPTHLAELSKLHQPPKEASRKKRPRRTTDLARLLTLVDADLPLHERGK